MVFITLLLFITHSCLKISFRCIACDPFENNQVIDEFTKYLKKSYEVKSIGYLSLVYILPKHAFVGEMLQHLSGCVVGMNGLIHSVWSVHMLWHVGK